MDTYRPEFERENFRHQGEFQVAKSDDCLYQSCRFDIYQQKVSS